MLEVDSLICRLPYKKMLKALCSPESTMANIPYVTRAYEVRLCPIFELSLDQSVFDLMLGLWQRNPSCTSRWDATNARAREALPASACSSIPRTRSCARSSCFLVPAAYPQTVPSFRVAK